MELEGLMRRPEEVALGLGAVFWPGWRPLARQADHGVGKLWGSLYEKHSEGESLYMYPRHFGLRERREPDGVIVLSLAESRASSSGHYMHNTTFHFTSSSRLAEYELQWTMT